MTFVSTFRVGMLCAAAFALSSCRAPHAREQEQTDSIVLTAAGETGQNLPRKRTFEARHEWRFKIPADAKNVRVWLPAPSRTDSAQRLLASRISSPWQVSEAEDQHGNTFYFLDVADPRTTEFNVVHEFTVERSEVSVSTDASKTRALSEAEIKDMERFLRPGVNTVVTDAIRAKAKEVVGAETNPVRQARLIYDFVLNHVEYWVKDPAAMKASGKGSSEYCFDKCTGNCTDFHALYIAMAIAVNLPTKCTYGSFFKSPLDGKDKDQSYHCWVEFWAPGIGWVPLDVAAADIFVKDLKLNDGNKDGVNLTVPDGYNGPDEKIVEYYFGNLEPRRVTWHLGRDLNLNPRQGGDAVNWLPKAYVEVDGKPLAEGKDTWQRKLTFREVK